MLKRIISFAVACSLIVGVSTPASARTIWLKNRVTKSGSVLGFETTPGVRLLGIARVFDYSILKRNGDIVYVDSAHTFWCRYGRIHFDNRADSQLNPVPGWWTKDGVYVVADSAAALHFLNLICKEDINAHS